MKKKQKGPKPQSGSTRILTLKANTSSTANLLKSIRIDRAFPLPDYVKKIFQELHEAGYVAYLVGGSVRDFLLNLPSKDYDIATDASPDEIVRLFPRSVTVGRSFGVLKIPTGTQPELVEIATFRQDLDYRDYRHPSRVVFSNPFEDAIRRDFTVNALFFDTRTSRILDATGGVEDLKEGWIRAIGHPPQRFREDALRLLRAVRFKTQFDFQLHPETAEAIRAHAKLILKVSAERTQEELTRMWCGPRPADALELLSELELLPQILPELAVLRGGEVWKHLLKTLHYLAVQNPHRSTLISWVAVLFDVGTPSEAAKIAQRIAIRLKMSRDQCEKIAAMVADHLKFKEVFQMRESTLLRWIRQPYFQELLAFHRAYATAVDGNLAYYEFCAARLEQLQKSSALVNSKLVDGRDLIQLGFQPGPEFSEILAAIEDLALEKKLHTKEEALEYIVKNFVK